MNWIHEKQDALDKRGEMMCDMPIVQGVRQRGCGSLERDAWRPLTDAEIHWGAQLIEAEADERGCNSLALLDGGGMLQPSALLQWEPTLALLEWQPTLSQQLLLLQLQQLNSPQQRHQLQQPLCARGQLIPSLGKLGQRRWRRVPLPA